MVGSVLGGELPPSLVTPFGLVSLPITSHRVMRGECFTIGKRITVPASGTAYIALDLSSVPVDKKIVVLPLSLNGIGGRVNIDFNVDPVFNTDGTILNGICRNIEKNNISDTIIRLNPTVTDEGNTGIEFLLPADGVGANISSSSLDTSLPILLDKSKKYLLKLHNQDATIVYTSINLSWFEF